MHRAFPVGLLFCAIAATIACYLPGLHGDFLFDDIPNIRNNSFLLITSLDWSSLWQAAMSSSAGMLKRPISMLTFALDHYFFGLNPYYFKATNLVIHLLNGIGIFVLSRQLLDLYRIKHRPQIDLDSVTWISLSIAVLWLLHPFNLTGVLYVVQRMASLSAFFTFWGLVLYLYGRKRLIEQKSGGMLAVLASILVFTPLAALSKENGILIPVFILLFELTILRWQAPDEKTRRALKIGFLFTVLMPAVLILGYIAINPAFITSGYHLRDFSLTERLMTEARVLWFYLNMTLLPNIASMGMHHDDIAISRGLFSPITTILSIAGLGVLLAGALLARNRYPLIALGIFFFLVGHSMESSVIGLELVFEHRNYLPMFGILLPAVYYLLSPGCHPSSQRIRRIFMATLIVFFAVLTFLRASQWGDPLSMMQMEVQHHPDSARANADLAFRYAHMPASSQLEAEENYRNAISHFSQAAYLSQNDTTGFFGVLAVNSERGLPTDASWTDELEKRLEHSPLMPNSINSLNALEKCYVIGRCAFAPETMERLLRAAIRNPSLTGPRRSMALFALSDFLLKVKKQPERAIGAAYLAAATAPEDVAEQVNLLAFLVNMKRYDEAHKMIDNVRAKDTWGRYTSMLDDLDKQLAAYHLVNKQ